MKFAPAYIAEVGPTEAAARENLLKHMRPQGLDDLASGIEIKEHGNAWMAMCAVPVERLPTEWMKGPKS